MKKILVLSMLAVTLFALIACASAAPTVAPTVVPTAAPTAAPTLAPTATPPPAPAQTSDPIGIVKAYYAAIKAKDLETALGFLADDVLLTSPQGKYKGKAEAQKVLASSIADGYYSDNTNYRETNGEVRYDYKVYINGTQVDANSDGLTIVKNGKIVFDGLERDNPFSVVTSSAAIAIVKNYYAAIKAHDIEAVMKFYADDALVTSPQGKFQGKEAIRKYMQGLLDQGYYSENTNYRDTNGAVRYDYQVFIGGAQVDQNTDGLTIIKFGKVIFDGLEKDNPEG